MSVLPHIFNVRKRRILDSEERLRITEPFSVLVSSDLREHLTLVDLGCGTGFYSIPASRIVGDGITYAVDIQEEMLATLHHKIRKLGINNIHVIMSGLHKLPLKDASLDRALLMNTLHEVYGKQAILREVSRVLKPDGKLSVVDWQKSYRTEDFGPPFEQRIGLDQAQRILEHRYFRLNRAFRAGPYHYGLLFGKR